MRISKFKIIAILNNIKVQEWKKFVRKNGGPKSKDVGHRLKRFRMNFQWKSLRIY